MVNFSFPLSKVEDLSNYKPGFFSWSGTKAYWDSNLPAFIKNGNFFFIFAIVVLFLLFVGMWVLKRQIIAKYKLSLQNNSNFYKYFHMTLGITILLWMIGRSLIIYFVMGYPRYWETIPVHFCRLMGIMLGVLLITNKLKYIKYVAPLAVLGTLMALLSPDLTMEVYFDKNVSQSDLDALSAQKIFLSGRDQYINFKVEEAFKLRWGIFNFIFWDYFFFHTFLLAAFVTINFLNPGKLGLKEISKTLLVCFMFVGAMASINHLLDNSPAVSINWKSNYWYLGTNKINNLSTLVPPFTEFPFSIFTFVLVGVAYLLFVSFMLALQDKVYINVFAKGKQVKFKIIESENYLYWKSSFKLAFSSLLKTMKKLFRKA